ncbi:protein DETOXIFICATION 14 [Sesamum angolense]|uniref:Protein DETOXIFICATION n=1 Tax=Sesamum angolense TaxID=2727404 RepID=A0AAE1WHR6_9LAMI|nr:protein DETOXIFICATION 14 [Sesamum angolense]
MEPEQPLLVQENKGTRSDFAAKWEVLSGEVYKVSWLVGPMIVVSVSQYLVRAVPMMMLGHLDELALSSAAIATSLSNVTGYSLIVRDFYAYYVFQFLILLLQGVNVEHYVEYCCGKNANLEWLVHWRPSVDRPMEQKHYHKVGTFTYGAIIWLFLACIPTQSLILPMLLSTVASLCVHLLLSWALIFKLKLGNAGAALSIGLSYWLNVIMLGLYVKYSSSCEKTRTSFSKDVFLTTREFFRFAIPSAVMNCLEWWTFEIVILCGGLLPNPELETSVLSICLTIISIHYRIQYAFGAAASTRVSNELGAGKAQAAQLAVSTVLVMSIVEFVIASTIIFVCRHSLGYLFSNEKGVVYYIKEMTPFLCISIVFDSLQAVFSGVARGSGWQHIGAYVNLGAYYVVGIPVSLLLGFVLALKGKGLWCGLIAGAMADSQLTVVPQAMEARRRIFEGKLLAHDELI